MSKDNRIDLDSATISRVIEMAWEDHTPFEAIRAQYGLTEPQVIQLMRREMQLSSFKMWRKRVSGRASKHASKASNPRLKHRAPGQNKLSLGK